MEKIRVLQVVPNMHAAGLETLIMNMYRNIDRSKVQFDFLVHYEERFFYDDEIEKLGGKIYRLSFRNDGNMVKYLKGLENFFSEHKYSIVHGHMASTACFYLGIAKKHNVPIRILHSHNTSTERTFKGFIKYQLLRCSTIFANQYFACGELAGKFLYKNKDFTVIHNAISLETFKPDNNERKSLRNELGIDDKFVIGHIGRFNTQKNHKFILDVFERFHIQMPHSQLVLVGEGELEKEIKNRVKEKGLSDCISFLGVRKDINAIYNMLDVFILPSLFEGLPVVGVECQAAGCRTLISDKVSKEIQLTSLVEFLPVEGDLAVDIWCEKLKECVRNKNNISINNVREKMKNSGYDITKEALNLVTIYRGLIGVE